MKITKINAFSVAIPFTAPIRSSMGVSYPARMRTLIEVHTDEGISGWGECGYNPLGTVKGTPQAAAFEGPITQLLKGDDPHDSEWIRRKMGYSKEESVAVELACWDIMGKATGQPVYRLLGGAVRDKIKAYANGWYTVERTPEEFHAAAKRVVARGYRALKFDPFGAGFYEMERAEKIKVISLVEAVRDAVGLEAEILIEMHGRFNPVTAIEFARLLAPYTPSWLEEPVPPENTAALKKVADAIAPYGENEIDLFNITAAPSAAHPLGTDELGRDELSRLIYGSRISLLVGVATALLATAIGIVVGALAGYYGGAVDAVLMRFVDVVLAFPAIFLLLILFSIQGSSIAGVIVFLGLFSWMWLARIIRGEFLSLKERDFIEAARAIGVPDGRIILRHLLPNVVAAIVVATTLNVAYAMLAEATLSFLGFGVPPGTPTWGNMLNAARPNYTVAPMLAIAPGLALTVAVLAINFIGDGLRDALDPRR